MGSPLVGAMSQSGRNRKRSEHTVSLLQPVTIICFLMRSTVSLQQYVWDGRPLFVTLFDGTAGTPVAIQDAGRGSPNPNSLRHGFPSALNRSGQSHLSTTSASQLTLPREYMDDHLLLHTLPDATALNLAMRRSQVSVQAYDYFIAEAQDAAVEMSVALAAAGHPQHISHDYPTDAQLLDFRKRQAQLEEEAAAALHRANYHNLQVLRIQGQIPLHITLPPTPLSMETSPITQKLSSSTLAGKSLGPSVQTYGASRPRPGIDSHIGFPAARVRPDKIFLDGSNRTSINTSQGVVQTEARSIFIGELHYDTTARGLKEHLGQAAEITQLNIAVATGTGRPKGYAIAGFRTRQEAQKVVQMFDGTEFMGRRLRVRLDKEQIVVRNTTYAQTKPKIPKKSVQELIIVDGSTTRPTVVAGVSSRTA
ncbi:MAG: Myelin expression factor 2 [Pycnora praestabilis]|nr:MAG: Myelin expression factor 2 [Pycnora praestabilis]